MTGHKQRNRLSGEKSPYLLQHAFNPVDWHPWGDEAFQKARKEDKPIFLSIGYSTCYWCHVMEREVFENDALAELMNRFVISIKVDREERPDVDRVYMAALQAMTGSGGWPLSMFLTPDLKPFFGATYIPPEAKFGRAGFREVLTRIHEIWTTDRQNALEAGEQLLAYVRQISDPRTKGTDPGPEALSRGAEVFSKNFDPDYGGFGIEPKFPRPVVMNFLLRYYKRTGGEQALAMCLKTLKNMHQGGMYDHVGGGFHRYATDRTWHLPHFEKMLYDQAQLVGSYLEAFQCTRNPHFAVIAGDTLDYVLRELRDPGGGFYSAQDAESAVDANHPEIKKEGAFYVWSARELRHVLSPDEYSVFESFYGIREEGNVTADSHGEFRGLNILHIVTEVEDLARKLNMDLGTVNGLLSSGRTKLLQTRSKRPLPYLDDKILVSWNGLMISAFARGFQVLGTSEYLDASGRAAEFILSHLDDGKNLQRRFRDGEARFEAHLEDYAFFIQGLLDLYEASLNIAWLQQAYRMTERMIGIFYDQAHGGFYDISGSDSSILVRTKEFYDGAEPSGNSIAILDLLRLSQMTNTARFDNLARESLGCFGERTFTVPEALPQFLVALDFALGKPKQIIIAGTINAPDTVNLLSEVHGRFIPNKILLLVDEGQGRRVLESFLPLVKDIGMLEGRATAYVCELFACQLPTNDPRILRRLLEQ